MQGVPKVVYILYKFWKDWNLKKWIRSRIKIWSKITF